MKILAARYNGETIYNEFVGKVTRFGEYLNSKIGVGLTTSCEFPRHGLERCTIKASGYDEAYYKVDLSTSEANMTRFDEITFSSYRKDGKGKYVEVSTTQSETTNVSKLMTEYEKFLINCFHDKYEKELNDFDKEYDSENVHTYLISVVDHIAKKRHNASVINNIIKTINTSR